MSCAWPLFQVNLWGVFDHARDLNDHQVIERRNSNLKERQGQKMITQLVVEGGENGERGENGRLRSEI